MDINTDALGDVPDADGLLQELSEYRASHDLGLRDKLVCDNLNLVHSVARRFSGMGESLDDLIQEGTIGLLNAVDMFDADRGVKFSTYASHLITGNIQHYLRDRGRLIRQPAWVQELSSRVTKATEELSQKLGYEPQPDEIALHLELTTESINTVHAARDLSYVVSLTTPTEMGDNEMNLADNDKLLLDKLTMLQLPLEDRIVIEEALGTLRELEQKVVQLYFFGGLNQTEIAHKLSISINYTSYLLRRSMNKLKAILEEKHGGEQKKVETQHVPIVRESLPHFDDIVGVYTGSYLRERVEEEVARSQRYPTNFTLMLAAVRGIPKDPDEQIPVLQAIGTMMRSSTHNVDLTAYQGNGRFALHLPHTGREARVLGERLCQKITNSSVLGNNAKITFNVGYAVFPIDGADANVLFNRAEKALRSAVREGKNNTVAYSGALG